VPLLGYDAYYHIYQLFRIDRLLNDFISLHLKSNDYIYCQHSSMLWELLTENEETGFESVFHVHK